MVVGGVVVVVVVVVGLVIVQGLVLVLVVEDVDMEVAVEVDVDVDVDVNGDVDVDVVVVVVMHTDLLINVQSADDNASQQILEAWSQATRQSKRGVRCVRSHVVSGGLDPNEAA